MKYYLIAFCVVLAILVISFLYPVLAPSHTIGYRGDVEENTWGNLVGECVKVFRPSLIPLFDQVIEEADPRYCR